MSIVSLLGIKVLNNPAKFTDPYEFEITFECLEQLKDDLEWKLTYVGSSRSLEHDQELDSLLVGPIPVGINKFILTADAPSPELIPASELVSVTVILLSCSYKEREFVRVGYYVNNEYDSEELRENPPTKVQVDHIVRNILAEKPRVTRFNIAWDNDNNLEDYPPEQDEIDGEEEIEEDEIIDMGIDEYENEDENENDDDEGEEGDEDGNGNENESEEQKEIKEGQEQETENNDSKITIDSAKRQNTINDDDIPEIKKRKLANEKTEEEEAEDKEEDLDELEEEDEEELEEELEEEGDDDDDDDEELEEEVGEPDEGGEDEGEEDEEQEELEELEDKEEIEETGTGNENESAGIITSTNTEDNNAHHAETPKIDSSAPTPTETTN